MSDIRGREGVQEIRTQNSDMGEGAGPKNRQKIRTSFKYGPLTDMMGNGKSFSLLTWVGGVKKRPKIFLRSV